ncbi:YqzG/YhdC family protein [Pseudalkalibacillus sp. A8]|uniref:YqzG/YhdC family protein n=1 Tax=Pseudalkalibacillus sp. A8 TaxID=3382641 RepID=UPI0038B696B6
MKMFIALPFVACLFFGENTIVMNNSNNMLNESQQVPSYAKWGQIAVQRTKEKYPDVAIIDYLHIGRESGTKFSTEKFKLWLKEDNKEFGVFVDIKFNNVTEQIIDITFEETPK